MGGLRLSAMKAASRACFRAACALLVLAWSVGLSTFAQGAESTQLLARRAAMLQSGADSPWPSPECRINQPSACLWGKLSLAFLLLQLRSDAVAGSGDGERASALFNEAIDLQEKGLQSEAVDRNSRPQEDEQDTLRLPSFHFLTATLLHRALFQYGPERFGGNGLVSSETAARIVGLFARWARERCRIAETRPEMVWHPWGSENHDLQLSNACWASADLLVRDGQGSTFIYADGSSAVEQWTRWTAFLKYYIRSRALNGGFIEFFSPTYIKYDLSVIYNLYDGSRDEELRALASSFATLWWAMWAQEQVGTAHGGSKARRYDNVRQSQFIDGGIAWFYLGGGAAPGPVAHPAFLPLLVSRYRPPQIVLDLMAQAANEAPFEVWTRELALAGGPSRDRRYDVAQTVDGVSRYTYVAPGFIMGTVISGRTPEDRLLAISSQNRWSGLTLLGRKGNLVFARPKANRTRSTYNAVIGVQKFGTQIVQALAPPYSRNVGEMVLRFSKGMDLVERAGWIFAADSAYVAARPAFGSYQIAAETGEVRPLNSNSPIIIQASPLAAYPSFQAFQDAVLSAPLVVKGGMVTFSGLQNAGEVSLPLDATTTVTDKPGSTSPPAGWTLYSPFVRQKTGAHDIDIRFKGQTLQLTF